MVIGHWSISVHLASRNAARPSTSAKEEYCDCWNAWKNDDHSPCSISIARERQGPRIFDWGRSAGSAYRKPPRGCKGPLCDGWRRVRQRILRQAQQIYSLLTTRGGLQ